MMWLYRFNMNLRKHEPQKGVITMKKMFLSSILVFSASSGVAAYAQELTGDWNIHNAIGGSDSDMKCTFTQKGKELTGTCKGDSGPLNITGTVDDKKLTWKYDTDYNGQTLTLVYKATFDNPAKITGSVDVQPMDVTGDFTATPAKDPGK